MIDDELLVKTLTNTCLSYTSAIPSYSVMECCRFVVAGCVSTFQNLNFHKGNRFFLSHLNFDSACNRQHYYISTGLLLVSNAKMEWCLV